VRQSIRQSADPIRSADVQWCEEFPIAEEIDAFTNGRPDDCAKQDHSAADVFPSRARRFAHRPIQHEADPVTPTVVESLQRRAGIEVLVPIESIPHRQQITHGERRLAIVHVRDRLVLREAIDCAVIEMKASALDGETSQQRRHAFSDRLNGMDDVGSRAGTEVFLDHELLVTDNKQAVDVAVVAAANAADQVAENRRIKSLGVWCRCWPVAG
jgi:hypothetical protein